MVHITYPTMSMSYSYAYITFIVIYYTICYVLFSCTVTMYCHRVLFSRTVHVLFSYTIFMLYFSYYFPFHILYLFIYFSCIILCTFHILIHVPFHVLCTFHILSSCTLYCIIILTFQIILHSYTFSYIMLDSIISCYRTYLHITVLCFSDHIISFHMSYSNHLFYVSCMHKP